MGKMWKSVQDLIFPAVIVTTALVAMCIVLGMNVRRLEKRISGLEYDRVVATFDAITDARRAGYIILYEQEVGVMFWKNRYSAAVLADLEASKSLITGLYRSVIEVQYNHGDDPYRFVQDWRGAHEFIAMRDKLNLSTTEAYGVFYQLLLLRERTMKSNEGFCDYPIRTPSGH